jgi:hypothetical protein
MSIPISINQIRHLQRQEPGNPFALELASGRIIQIYDSYAVASSELGKGSIGVLHQDGVFEVFAAEAVVSVSVGMHPAEEARWEKRRENLKRRFGGGDPPTENL